MKIDEEYITINPFDIAEVRKYKNITLALDDSVKLNKSDDDHPRFCLYKNTSSQIVYIGKLTREFGTDTFYFE